MLSDTKHASSEIKSHSYQNDHQTNLKKVLKIFNFLNFDFYMFSISFKQYYDLYIKMVFFKNKC